MNSARAQIIPRMITMTISVVVTILLTGCPAHQNGAENASGVAAQLTDSPQATVAPGTLEEDGGGVGDAGGGQNTRPSFEDIKNTVTKLDNDYDRWAIRPIAPSYYKDENGAFKKEPYVSLNSSPELQAMLLKVGIALSRRPDPSKPFVKFEFKEKGGCPCPEGECPSSTILCDPTAPICLSLPLIQAQTPKVGLETAIQSLLMHEVSHQQCADEVMAKQVEAYFDNESLQKLPFLESIRRTFDLVQWRLRQMQRGLNPAKFPHRKDGSTQSGKVDEPRTNQELCLDIGGAHNAAQSLYWDLVFVEADYGSMSKLEKIFEDMENFCSDSQWKGKPLEVGDRDALSGLVDKAVAAYDIAAIDSKKRFGIMIWNFTTYQDLVWVDPAPTNEQLEAVDKEFADAATAIGSK